jgi:hypothetical protein
MTTACKLNHDDPDTLPKFLCRVCNPDKSAPVKPTAPTEPVLNVDPEAVKTNMRKRRRRLRAEVKELADELEKFKLARVGKDMIEGAERRWRLAYQELATLTDKLDDADDLTCAA